MCVFFRVGGVGVQQFNLNKQGGRLQSPEKLLQGEKHLGLVAEYRTLDHEIGTGGIIFLLIFPNLQIEREPLQRLVPRHQPGNFIENLRQGAELVSFNSREREVDEEGFSYREITVFLTMKSNFRSVENFVRALERIPAVLSMRDFEIVRTRANYPRVETTFTLKFYVM